MVMEVHGDDSRLNVLQEVLVGAKLHEVVEWEQFFEDRMDRQAYRSGETKKLANLFEHYLPVFKVAHRPVVYHHVGW
jgi:hypothetical protein